MRSGCEQSLRNNLTLRSAVCLCSTKDILSKLMERGQIGRRYLSRLKEKETAHDRVMFDPSLVLDTKKISSKWIEALNMKDQTVEFSGEN